MASHHPQRVAPPEVTITRVVGHGVALAALAAGQLFCSAWMLMIGLTSGSQALTRVAFIEYVACSAVAWWIAAGRPGRAVLVMAAGCAALVGLLLVAGA